MGNVFKSRKGLYKKGDVEAGYGRQRSHTGAMMNLSMKVTDFEFLTVVGKGSFGKVMQVKLKSTGEIFAMKVLKKKALIARKQVAHTKTERNVLENIQHPFIVSLRFAFQSKTKLYMILDFFNGGELFYHLKNEKRFSEDRARFYAAEIILAFEELHRNNIVYRDLKPENILLDSEGHLRLTDFGLSKDSISGDKLTHTFCGTPEYLAPEILYGKGYSFSVDWWSMGAFLYEMLTGWPPFYHDNVKVLYDKILNANVKYPSYVSEPAKDVIHKLLQRDISQRLGCGGNGAAEVKSHPFFESIDWNELLKKKIPPPFIPVVKQGELDTSNIDKEFTRERPKDTPVADSSLENQIVFSNFTYDDTRNAMKEADTTVEEWANYQKGTFEE